MSIAIFLLLALITAAAIVYPLLPATEAGARGLPVEKRPSRTGGRGSRQVRAGGEPTCPSCGMKYEPGDRFCVGCGASLSGAGDVSNECQSCGAVLRPTDRFCPRCGQPLRAEAEQ